MKFSEAALGLGHSPKLLTTVKHRTSPGFYDHQGEATVWSIPDQREIKTFTVNWSIGGRRLAFIEGDNPTVYCGAWAKNGLSAYSLEGACVWQRKDIKKIHTITPYLTIEGRPCLAVGVEKGALRLVDSISGKDIQKIAGVSRAFFGLHGYGLYATSDSLQITRGGVKTAYRIPLHEAEFKLEYDGQEMCRGKGTPSVSYVAFSPDALSIMLDGKLRCFSMKAEEIWSYPFDGDSGMWDVAWDGRDNSWVAFTQEREGGPIRLSRWNAEGVLVSQVALGDARRILAPDGRVLIYDEQVPAWRFFEEPEF